jgi:hypothetical protein
LVCGHFAAPETKKADVMEHPQAFDHVGLLVNKPPGTAGLPFIQSSDDFNFTPSTSRLQVHYGDF